MQFPVDHFRSRLQAEGLLGALRFLNRGVDHRYTSICRLDGVEFTNTATVDKAGQPLPAYVAAVPVHTTFCQFVLSDGRFATENSALDRRLDGIPFQGIVVAYHGVPLKNVRGDFVGTLNHFDMVERTLPVQQFDFLDQAAKLLAPFLPK